MIRLTTQTQILVAIEAVDFRKQIDSLVRLCKQLEENPRSGTYFVFINRARTMIRVLSYDGNRYWLCTKRLSQGRYQGWPKHDEKLSPLSVQRVIGIGKINGLRNGLSFHILCEWNLKNWIKKLWIR